MESDKLRSSRAPMDHRESHRKTDGRAGYMFVLAGRSENKLQSVSEEIRKQTGNENVRFEVVDLSWEIVFRKWPKGGKVLCTYWSIMRHGNPWKDRNRRGNWSAVCHQRFGLFPDDPVFYGISETSGEHVSSTLQVIGQRSRLKWSWFRSRKYNNDTAYRQSKQANAWWRLLLQNAWRNGITVNSCHPGDVNSKVKQLPRIWWSWDPDEGAFTPVWLATDPALSKNYR